jgi:hypothetical protein
MISKHMKTITAGVVALFMVFSASVSNKRDFSMKEVLISSIAWVESTNNPNARSKDGSVGIVQIKPVMVKEVNRICKMKGIDKAYSLTDRLSVQKSKEMFWIYQDFYNPDVKWDDLSKKDLEVMARKWNGGPNGDKKKATQKYWRKVSKRIGVEIENPNITSLE